MNTEEVVAASLRTGILLGFIAAHVSDCYRTDAADFEILEAWRAIDRRDPGPYFIDQARGFIETSLIFEGDRDHALRLFDAIVSEW